MRFIRKRNNEWVEVLVNYLGRKCTYCGSTKGLHIHHIIPLYLGGKNELGNLEVVCWEHHKDLHRQISSIFKRKYPKRGSICVCCNSEAEYVSGKNDKNGIMYYCYICNRLFTQ